ncbi:hypothetical protein OZD68_00825 [Wolbachia endosymbiont of Drosophila bicornuta]|uniref:hypothetical protein n=1 Tax=Wolbachia TaxID=953 RepID=UPI001C717117|nr:MULTISPECIES: hypothetical protein [Wolbachia]MBA8755141.1 hypothetical protein [Wolbachia pipientis]MDE5056159.1 hypothetical protein [Wolbachia endosymbiont of Drosophila bicornuta]
MLLGGSSEYSISRSKQAIQLNRAFIALFTIIRTDHNMLLLYHSHKHISYPIRTIARSAITHDIYSLSYNSPNAIRYVFMAIAGQ